MNSFKSGWFWASIPKKTSFAFFTSGNASKFWMYCFRPGNFWKS